MRVEEENSSVVLLDCPSLNAFELVATEISQVRNVSASGAVVSETNVLLVEDDSGLGLLDSAAATTIESIVTSASGVSDAGVSTGMNTVLVVGSGDSGVGSGSPSPVFKVGSCCGGLSRTLQSSG